MFMFAVMLACCAKCVSTETSTVQVKVTNAYHKASLTRTPSHGIYEVNEADKTKFFYIRAILRLNVPDSGTNE